ncbi:MAG: hypothetical protein JWR38_665 [Mucilaginibacter sp.]|nr:hypothetical protein [Mucilaginibacter sp.]
MPANQFDTLQYLAAGTTRQLAAYQLLKKYRLLETLHTFDPILAGTIPINIDIENSDLDIICCFTDKARFQQLIISAFAGFNGFTIVDTVINQQETIVANFSVDGCPIEVFGQYVPTREQNAYRHMIAEHQLLTHYGEPLRQQIIELKKQGYKTEPAFAKLLDLQGNPYLELLKPELISSLKNK